MMWAQLKLGINVGDVFKSRTGREYIVKSIDDKGYTIARADTGSTVRASSAKIENASSRLLAGESIRYQATPTNGGVSYTVGVTVAVMYPLRHLWKLDNVNKSYSPM